MVDKRSTNIANAVLSCVVLMCGVVSPILVWLMLRKIHDMELLDSDKQSFDKETYRFYSRKTSLWYLSVVYILPGIMGLIASVIQREKSYNIQAGFASQISCLMLMLVPIWLTTLTPLTDMYTGCLEVGSGCLCSSSHRESYFGSSCADINYLSALCIGVITLNVIGIVGGFATCVTVPMIVYCTDDSPRDVDSQRRIQDGERRPSVTVTHTFNQQMGVSNTIPPDLRYKPQVKPNLYVELPNSQSSRKLDKDVESSHHYEELKF